MYKFADGCPLDEDEFYSWSEADLTDALTLSCPCGVLDTVLTINREATRVCGGSFSAGVEWLAPDTAACQFNAIAESLCEITTVTYRIEFWLLLNSSLQLDAVARSEAFAIVTTFAGAFEPLDVTISAEIVLDIIADNETQLVQVRYHCTCAPIPRVKSRIIVLQGLLSIFL